MSQNKKGHLLVFLSGVKFLREIGRAQAACWQKVTALETAQWPTTVQMPLAPLADIIIPSLDQALRQEVEVGAGGLQAKTIPAFMRSTDCFHIPWSIGTSQGPVR